MKRSLYSLLMVITLLALGACGDDSGSRDGTSNLKQPEYDIQLTSPPGTGVQVNRPFSVTLHFLEPSSAMPMNVSGVEAITASVISGPGVLGGTVTLPGNGSDTLVFDNLMLPLQGDYVLKFDGLSARQPVATTTFSVGPPRSIRFTKVPGDAIKNRAFALGVEVYDPLTGLATTPTTAINVTVSLAAGAGTLGGTLTRILNGGKTLDFPNLTYDQNGVIALRVSSFGFPDTVTTSFMVDSVVMSFSTAPQRLPVNGGFALSIDLTGQYSGRPIEPDPAMDGTLSLVTGTGNLAGTLVATNVGSRITFAGLSYDQPGTATFQVTSLDASAVTSAAMNFGLQLEARLVGDSIVSPGSAFGTTEIRLVDASGLAWNSAAPPVDWAVTDAGGQQVQAGQVALTGGLATISPASISTTGGYTLSASVGAPVSSTATLALGVTTLNLVNTPGTFVALKSVRVNDSYSDSVSAIAPASTINFGLLAGSIPAGLSINGGNGEILGTPTQAGSFEFTMYADLGGGNAHPIRCALAVFESNEREIVPGRDFKVAGSFTPIGPITESFTFTSSYDGITYPQGSNFNCRVQYYYPDFATAPAVVPVYIHHRGRSFDMGDYDNLGAHLASHGIAFVSVEDYQSFFDGGASGNTPNTTYDNNAEQGMLSASAFQEGVMDWLAQVNAQSGHPLYQRVDAENIFMGGHSRGGGATQASHTRSQPYVFSGTEQPALALRGVVYFMGFDLRSFNATISGSNTVYPIPAEQGRLPSLLIAAENDRDLFYPICDQFIERATGPATFATIYGACHNYMGDATSAEPDYSSQGIGVPYITRTEQQERAFNLVVAFIKRWAGLDLSLEGLLYNNELAGSQEVGVTAWRNMTERVVIDDHQTGTKSANTLGGANTLSAGTWTTSGSVYPSWGALGTVGVRHNILTLVGGTGTTYASEIPPANQDLSHTRRVIFRIGQIDQAGPKGFDWVTVKLRLTDKQNDTATVTLFDRQNQHGQYLPDYVGSGNNYFDRFVEGNVTLETFMAMNTNLNTDQLDSVEFVFETAQGASRQIYLDDLRFE